MLNVNRGTIYFFTKNPDEDILSFGNKHKYDMHYFAQTYGIIQALKNKEKPIAIIIDAEYPGLFDTPVENGMLLFELIKKQYEIPIIMYSPISDEIEHNLNIYGLNRIINKPFVREIDLVTILTMIQESESPTETGIFEDDFCGLFIDDFLYVKHCPFDIFCRISDNKILKIVNAYDPMNAELIGRLKLKGVVRLWLKRADYKKWVAINAYSDIKGVTGKEKLSWIQRSSEIMMDHLYMDGVNIDIFFAAKQIVETTLDVVADNKMMFQLINSLNAISEDAYRHSLGVSVYSVLIAAKMKLNDPKIKFRLSIAGLFSDIGLKNLPDEIVDKPRTLYSHKELKEYERHPDYSLDILRTIKGLPEDLLQIIVQHHENNDGSGFPNRVSNIHIHPLAKIIRVADEFCFLTLKSKHNQNTYTPVEALKEMKNPALIKRFDADVLKGLEELLFNPSVAKKAA